MNRAIPMPSDIDERAPELSPCRTKMATAAEGPKERVGNSLRQGITAWRLRKLGQPDSARRS